MFESPLGGILGATTCSVYRLDPTGTVPLEPIPDLLPGVFTPFRVTLDIVESEQYQSECEITQHAIQDFLDTISHVHVRLDVLTVNGTLGAGLKPMPALPGPGLPGPGIPSPAIPGAFARLDLLRVKNLRRLQKARVPLMVVTPRDSLAKCFLATVASSYAKDDGDQTTVTLVFIEARVVSPLLGAEVAPDYPAQAAGNNAASGGGQAATTTVDAGATAPSAPGAAPTYPSAVGPPS